MCRAVACKTCGKTTWAGCGQHADAVMASVPPADRCTCTSAPSAPGRSNGRLADIFGRRG